MATSEVIGGEKEREMGGEVAGDLLLPLLFVYIAISACNLRSSSSSSSSWTGTAFVLPLPITVVANESFSQYVYIMIFEHIVSVFIRSLGLAQAQN